MLSCLFAALALASGVDETDKIEPKDVKEEENCDNPNKVRMITLEELSK